MTVADLMRSMLLLIGAIALVAWVTTHPFRRVRDAPRQMINTFAESAKIREDVDPATQLARL